MIVVCLMPVLVVMGIQWGDEGKAKAIDYFAKDTDFVVRYQGGNNAGHTVIVDGNKYVFHLVPSGILLPHVVCVLGGGMVIDLFAFIQEVNLLEERGIQIRDRIRLADNAHMLLPFHKELDVLSEKEKLELNHSIGTTKKGIGNCYVDKIARQGIRLSYLLDKEFYTDYLPYVVEKQNRVLTKIYDAAPHDVKKLSEQLKDVTELIKPFLVNAPYYLNMAIRSDKRILLEGAQGAMLDVDFGTYPYVTSSNPSIGGALTGTGINFRYITDVIGIVKTYTTRVGEGPFPTELDGEENERLRKLGHEFGATTGRPRRCGWLDIQALKYVIKLNGCNILFLTKLDVLDSYSTIKIGIEYELYGQKIDYVPSYAYNQVKVIYHELPGWNSSTEECRVFSDLPPNAQSYILTIEKHCGIPIKWISVGPERHQTIEVS